MKGIFCSHSDLGHEFLELSGYFCLGVGIEVTVGVQRGLDALVAQPLLQEKEDALDEADAAEKRASSAKERADAAEARINELAPKLKNIEEYAREYSDDADRVLPEAGALESAKSYREKKVKPLFEKLT